MNTSTIAAAEVCNERGNSLFDTGLVAEAIVCYRQAVALAPAYADAHNNLGIALFAQGQPNEASECFRKAVEINPIYANALNNLGNTLKTQGLFSEAADCYRRALRINPGHPNAHNNLGNALKEQGLLAEAADCFRKAIQIVPNHVDVSISLGNVLTDLGKPSEAEGYYRHALRLAPNHALAHYNLGNALVAQGELSKAAECFRQALRLNPADANAHHNLGNVLVSQGELLDAVACYQNALQLKPDNPTFLIHLVHQLQHLCHWKNQTDLTRRLLAAVREASAAGASVDVPPFPFLVLPEPTTAAEQLDCARLHTSRLVKSRSGLDAASSLPFLPRTHRDKSKITLGYLSADLHNHATAHLIAGLFECHGRSDFEVAGYSLGPDDGSAMRRRLVGALDRFVDLRTLSDNEAAQRIHADGVDILIDLNGYAGSGRTSILALRPAPIQVNYLGYPGTMGAPFMDYILVDDFITGPEQQAYFTEQLVFLPGCYQANDRERAIASTPSRAECGLPPNGLIFCDFNNNYKITSRMFDCWMRLLEAIPESVLWLLEGNRFVADRLRCEAEARGISARHWSSLPKHQCPNTWPATAWPICFSTRFPYVRTPRRAMPSGQAARC